MKTQKPRRSLPIFAKCLIIFLAACCVLVGTLTYMASQSSKKIAAIGIDAVSSSLTEIMATQIAGSMRFRATDAILEDVSGMLESTGMSETFLVQDSNGKPVASMPANLAGQASALMKQLGALAASQEQLVRSDDGLTVAVPIFFGDERQVIGSLVVFWDPNSIHEQILADRNEKIVISVGLVLAMSVFAIVAFRKAITSPLGRVNERTEALANGDLASDVPLTERGDEVGKTARALEHLRTMLADAEVARKDAMFQRAGFQSSATASIICDADLVISHSNESFKRFATDNLDSFRKRLSNFDPDNLIGTTPDAFHGDPAKVRAMLPSMTFPHVTEIKFGDMLMDLTINRITDADGQLTGYVVEYADATEDRTNLAIMEALEQAMVRADFDASGKLRRASNGLLKTLGASSAPRTTLVEFVKSLDGTSIEDLFKSGRPQFGKYKISYGGADIILDGSVSPTKSRKNETTGFVLLGKDITAAERQLQQATEENEKILASQATVVTALKASLTSLSEGNLQTRINDRFRGQYEVLQSDFNAAVTALDSAISEILVSADTILGEADNVSSAADDLSRRTEQQAATLEETAAAISELTASVSSAASGAKQASDVVEKARTNAETSGDVVQQAVNAMGEIEQSSNQISTIISVIDEIAFQTNLLALNAGVEAARAGEAGRGFAVVASEVRALAQRSSEAAREISDLISTSGEQVKKGVSLVDKAGVALTEIVQSISGIAEHVSSIASSAREQSSGLDEINLAMNQLDQVTQKNVAMFEETMAASKTVTGEANTLVGITRRFECGQSVKRNGTGASRPFASAAPAPTTGEALRTDMHTSASPVNAQQATGNLALAPQNEIAEDDDWEEF